MIMGCADAWDWRRRVVSVTSVGLTFASVTAPGIGVVLSNGMIAAVSGGTAIGNTTIVYISHGCCAPVESVVN